MILNPLDHETWDDFILAQPHYSFFHSAAWARTLCQSYGYTPCYVAVGNGGRISAALPLMDVRSRMTGRRGIALPFTDSCAPLCASDGELEQLLEQAFRHGDRLRWRRLELRTPAKFPKNAPFYMHVEHTLDLHPPVEALFRALESSVRRAIRKAGKEGITIAMDDSLDAMRTFYRLNCTTRKRHGLPPQPFAFFRHLHHNAIARGQGIVLAASHQGRVIASAIFLHLGRRALYKYGASDARHLRLRPNNVLLWQAIRHYAQRGYEFLSLGKTRLDNTGLLRFKRGWGCAETALHYYRYDFGEKRFVPPHDPVAGRHNHVFRYLPLPLARTLGVMLYRHVA